MIIHKGAGEVKITKQAAILSMWAKIITDRREKVGATHQGGEVINKS